MAKWYKDYLNGNASLHAANETSTDKIIIFKKAIVAPFVEFASILKKSGNFLETKYKFYRVDKFRI